MDKSACLLFPFKYDNENECLKRATTIEDTVVSCIRSFVVTRKGSRLGTNLGSFLPELLLQGVPSSKLPALADELKSELEEQFAGVNFLEVIFLMELIDNVSTLRVKIRLFVPTNPNIIDIDLDLPSLFTK